MPLPIVIKRGTNIGQVRMQPGMVTVPMAVNSTPTPASIPNVMINEPGGQDVVVTTQNLSSAQPTVIPNVKILNMMPGALAVASQKSVPTKVMMSTPQVVGTRATTSITRQTVQGLQPGQKPHLLFNTENGLYKHLRVVPAPAAGTLTAPQAQTTRLSTMSAHPGVATFSTSVAAPGPMPGQMSAPLIRAPVVASDPSVAVGTPPPLQHQPRSTTPIIKRRHVQILQPGQKRHLLFKKENGRYKFLRVVRAPAASTPTAPRAPTIRLSTVSAHPGVATFSTSVAAPGPMPEQMLAPLIRAPVVASDPSVAVGTPPPLQHQPRSTTPIKPAQKNGGKITILENIPLATKIDMNKVGKAVKRKSTFPRSTSSFAFTASLSTVLTPGKSLLKEQNKEQNKEKKSSGLFSQPFVDDKMAGEDDINDVVAMGDVNLAEESQRILESPEVIGTQIRSCKEEFLVPTTSKHNLEESAPEVANLNKEKKSSGQFSQPFVDDKMAGEDDINDVVAMGDVNLAEESQRILESQEVIGTQIRSCKEKFLVPTSLMQARLKVITSKHNLEESAPEVANLMSHALQERLKTLVEKLATVAQQRVYMDKNSGNQYEITQDVKGQLKFLEEIEHVAKKRREDSERGMLLRAAKSRSKKEDPEQAELKAKAKEMQRAELEELRQREANLTALQATEAKKARLDLPGGSGDNSTPSTARSEMSRTSLKRINLRDMMFMMEQDRDLRRSLLLYKLYAK